MQVPKEIENSLDAWEWELGSRLEEQLYGYPQGMHHDNIDEQAKEEQAEYCRWLQERIANKENEEVIP